MKAAPSVESSPDPDLRGPGSGSGLCQAVCFSKQQQREA